MHESVQRPFNLSVVAVGGREAVKQLKGYQNENQQQHAELVDCEASKQTLQRKVLGQQEKLEKITLQHRVKEDSVKSELNELSK